MVLINKHVTGEKENTLRVINSSIFNYHSDAKLFEYSVEVLNVIRVMLDINVMHSKLGLNYKLDPAMYYKSIDCLLQERKMEEEDVLKYFEITIKCEEYVSASVKISDIQDLYIPYEVDFLMLGMDIDKYLYLDEKQKDNLCEAYGDINVKMRFKQEGVQEFIKQARELISQYE